MYDFVGGKRYRILLYALVIIGSITWVGLLFVGCKQKTTPKPSQYGYVSFNIKWDSVSHKVNSNDVLRFCFYPADNGPMIQTDTDTGALRIALAPGKYGLLVYNYGKDNFLLRNRTQFQQMEVAFRDEEESGFSKAAFLPVYGAVIREFEVKHNQDVVTTITPTFFTKRIQFKVKLPKDYYHHITDCKGVLSGVSPLMSILQRTLKRESTTALSMPFGKNDSGFEGDVILLNGSCYDEDKDNAFHKLTLHFTLKDGKNISSTLDLGTELFGLKDHDTMVYVNALIDKESETEIKLSCESIGMCPNIP